VNKAIDREKQLKRWNRAKKVWLIERRNPTWEDLAAEWFTPHMHQPDKQVPPLRICHSFAILSCSLFINSDSMAGDRRALGIGANAAIFTLVRGVLLKPLVNRGEDRLIYIRQSAPGIRDENSTFSVPELQGLRANVKTMSVFGEFSAMDFTMIGLGEPRSI
jgi:hypothetical protein